MAQRKKSASSATEPRPPFPVQHQRSPGVEAELSPLPRFQAEAYQPAGKLKNKVALITGGDSEIGRAVAVMFAREGAAVAINYLPVEQEDAEKTRNEVQKHGNPCALFPGDLTDRKFCDALIAKTVAKFDRLDILVSNAAHQRRQGSAQAGKQEVAGRSEGLS